MISSESDFVSIAGFRHRPRKSEIHPQHGPWQPDGAELIGFLLSTATDSDELVNLKILAYLVLSRLLTRNTWNELRVSLQGSGLEFRVAPGTQAESRATSSAHSDFCVDHVTACYDSRHHDSLARGPGQRQLPVTVPGLTGTVTVTRRSGCAAPDLARPGARLPPARRGPQPAWGRPGPLKLAAGQAQVGGHEGGSSVVGMAIGPRPPGRHGSRAPGPAGTVTVAGNGPGPSRSAVLIGCRRDMT
jgi:hypothetical protein